MPIEFVIVIAALIISWLVFTAFINIVKTSVKTAVMVALFVLALQLAFGIRSEQLIEHVLTFPRIIWEFFTQ